MHVCGNVPVKCVQHSFTLFWGVAFKIGHVYHSKSRNIHSHQHTHFLYTLLNNTKQSKPVFNENFVDRKENVVYTLKTLQLNERQQKSFISTFFFLFHFSLTLFVSLRKEMMSGTLSLKRILSTPPQKKKNSSTSTNNLTQFFVVISDFNNTLYCDCGCYLDIFCIRFYKFVYLYQIIILN